MGGVQPVWGVPHGSGAGDERLCVFVFEASIVPGEMAIYAVPPKPPKLVHTKVVCNVMV